VAAAIFLFAKGCQATPAGLSPASAGSPLGPAGRGCNLLAFVLHATMVRAHRPQFGRVPCRRPRRPAGCDGWAAL